MTQVTICDLDIMFSAQTSTENELDLTNSHVSMYPVAVCVTQIQTNVD